MIFSIAKIIHLGILRIIIKKYIDEYEVLRDYETFEIMPIFNRYKELDCLKYFIKKEYYTSFFVDLAIMYVNLGFLYAKSQLKKNDLNNYLIGFEVFYIEENVKPKSVIRNFALHNVQISIRSL